nr:extracellular protease inhibitor 10-like [Rhipicephalus microplus]
MAYPPKYRLRQDVQEPTNQPSNIRTFRLGISMEQQQKHNSLTSTEAPPVAESPGSFVCGAPCNESFPVPVCGSNGRVYNSECSMMNANCRKQRRKRGSTEPVQVVEWERCRGRHPLCPDKCLDIYDPVCGKDGRFYPNLCIMQRRNCGKVIGTQTLAVCIASARESRKLNSCPQDCSELYEPVCGSNGEVYLNECFFKKETCGSKEPVQMAPLSRCLEPPKCPKRCLPILDPVCGSDGQRYLNHCRMQQRNCGRNVVVMPKSFCS